jgi:FkbM family methyltransferase
VRPVSLGGPYTTVFDVGGNLGSFAASCQERWPHARIISFEPLPDVAEENRARANGRWAVVPLGLADAAGTREMNRNLGSSGASSLLRPGSVRAEAFGAVERYAVVRAGFSTLDAHAELIEPPALLKIDVEGAELLVLEGGLRALPLFEAVLIEVNESPDCFLGAPRFDELQAVLAPFGFFEAGELAELRDPRDGSVLQRDVLWLRRPIAAPSP